MTRLALALLTAVVASPAFAEEAAPSSVPGLVLKRGDAASCAEFRKRLQDGTLVIDADLRKAVDAAVCAPPKKRPWDISLDGMLDMRRGNESYTHVRGATTFQYRFDKRQRLKVTVSDEYQSDAEYGSKMVAVFAAHYYFAVTNHWALFAQADARHDGPKGISVEATELGGILYSVFGASQRDRRLLEFSAGAGHRYDLYADDSVQSHPVWSYRAAAEFPVVRYLKFASVFWFQYRVSETLDWPDDYRTYFEARLKTDDTFSKRYTLSLSVEDEYNSKPFVSVYEPDEVRKKNDFKLLAGFGLKF